MNISTNLKQLMITFSFTPANAVVSSLVWYNNLFRILFFVFVFICFLRYIHEPLFKVYFGNKSTRIYLYALPHHHLWGKYCILFIFHHFLLNYCIYISFIYCGKIYLPTYLQSYLYSTSIPGPLALMIWGIVPLYLVSKRQVALLYLVFI